MTSAKQIQWESLGRHEDSVGGGTSPSELRRVVNMMKRIYKYVVNQLKEPGYILESTALIYDQKFGRQNWTQSGRPRGGAAVSEPDRSQHS